MATQQRIYELDSLILVQPSEAGYVDPSTLYLAVDKQGLSKPLKYSLADILTSAHVEQDVLTPSSTSVSVTYEKQFSTTSYFLYVSVYKYITMGGRQIKQSHPYYDFTKTITGFSMTLETLPSETLYVEYMCFESLLITGVSGLQSALDKKVNKDDSVDETITGIKTFSSFPVTPSSLPTSDYEVANKKYADSLIQNPSQVNVSTSGTLSASYNRFNCINSGTINIVTPLITSYNIYDKIYISNATASEDNINITAPSGIKINNLTSRTIKLYNRANCVELEKTASDNWMIRSLYGIYE